MPKNVAVICEVNPLHRGHEIILEEARRRADGGAVIAVMSGLFMQRATPAVFDQYTRAETLLEAGVDLVVELPFPWCAGSAEFFGGAGVAVAKAAGAELLLFGSESGDAQRLTEAVRVTRSDLFRQKVDELYADGQGYAVAREEAMRALAPQYVDLMQNPNDALGLAYIGECLERQLPFGCICRTRDCVTSATELRKVIASECENDWISRCSAFSENAYRRSIAEKRGPMAETDYLDFLRTVLSTVGDFLPAGAESSGGIGDRLINVAKATGSGEAFLAQAATKKYTNARLRRAALFTVCGVTEKLLRDKPSYALLLGADEKGTRLLRQIAKESEQTIPIVTKPADAALLPGSAREQIAVNRRAEAIYASLMPEARPADWFVKQKPTIKKNSP